MTTPPLPSSSPAPTTELMELSPLPHKLPFLTDIELISPSPIPTPAPEENDDVMLDSPAPIKSDSSIDGSMSFMSEFVDPKWQKVLLLLLTSLFSRKIAAPRRPSLTRMKNLTTSAVMSRNQAEAQLHPFQFGTDLDTLRATSSNLSADECFESVSPPQGDRSLPTANPGFTGPPWLRPRPPFPSVNSSSGHRFASPSKQNSRRSSNPFLRNRKHMRRSLSMFEHPADIVKPDLEVEEPRPSALRSVMDIEEVQEPQLPHFMADDPADCIPRITQETLLNILDGKYSEIFDQKMVIDCRFEYEYEGGHIDGAVNYNDKELLARQLFHSPMGSRTLLIFHCEYSVHRAPLMARHVRSEDRTVNAEHYPRLHYPEVYILEGGYSSFFSEHRGRCYPPAYVEMSDEKHQRTCEREMGRLKTRKGLGRAQTFAFGQRESCGDDSPTGLARPTSRQGTFSMMEDSPSFGERAHTRRMASY